MKNIKTELIGNTFPYIKNYLGHLLKSLRTEWTGTLFLKNRGCLTRLSRNTRIKYGDKYTRTFIKKVRRRDLSVFSLRQD